jgi:hypothetical protein
MTSDGVRGGAGGPRRGSSPRRHGRERTTRRLVQAAAGCWVLAELSVLGLGGRDAWPTLLGWAAAALVVVGAARVLSRVAQALAASVLVPVCVLLAFEGGLFFLPSAVVLTAAAVAALPRRGPPSG